MLIDSRNIMQRLSLKEKNLLASINLRMFHNVNLHPLLNLSPHHIYWLPVVIAEAIDNLDKEQYKAVRAFEEILTQIRISKKYHSITLREGQALIVNNEIILHARDTISNNSRRFLMRAYVK